MCQEKNASTPFYQDISEIEMTKYTNTYVPNTITSESKETEHYIYIFFLFSYNFFCPSAIDTINMYYTYYNTLFKLT